ncbi:MAG: class I SAM-dependent methyltransferase [Acidobacteriota bacterium]
MSTDGPLTDGPLTDDAAEAWKRQDRQYHEQKAIAGTYDRRVSRFYELDHRRYTLDPWSEKLRAAGARRVLDFGCGTGEATMRYLSYGFEMIAFDASVAMVAQLRAKARKAGLKVQCLVADGDHLPFRDGAVDAIICTGVLHHMPKVGSAVASQTRALGQGGLLFCSEPYDHRPWFSQPGHLLFGLVKGLRDLLRGLPPGPRERPLNRDDVAAARDALEAAGFEARIDTFSYWPYFCGFLPEGIAWPLMKFLDRLKSTQRGDAVRIEARERPR